MSTLVNIPVLLFLFTLIGLVVAARIGDVVRLRWVQLKEDQRDDYTLILTATLTLLGLIIGFSFSMATSRYDQRKNYEEAEANAIGTEYVRTDLLPAADGARVRELLQQYLQLRILFYEAERDDAAVTKINADTEKLQDGLWASVRGVATAQPTPITGLVVAGMNDVLNSQGYTQAAWWNRIPLAAWALMAAIAVGCNFLLGIGSHESKRTPLFLVVPLAVAISFFLIADIDSPRGGIIRVSPQNLLALEQSLGPH
jgi:hypothetical protein